MSLTFPFSLAAADSKSSAMLHSKGLVWVNGNEAPGELAIFSGDVIETKPGSVANLDTQGSSVLIQAESIVTWGENETILEHGSVSVGTSTEFRVKINCLTVIPEASQWTQYDVSDVSGTVHVVAHKLDVNIHQEFGHGKPFAERAGQSGTVHEGEQASREESDLCGAAKPPGPASGNPLSTTRWIEIGSGAGGGIILCVLLCRGKSPTSMSESSPQ